MGFDVTRAVVDAFESRTPVLDRIVSYMYFSDLAVLEQSTWDDFGAGESVTGTRSGGQAPGILLCAPLPTSRRVPFPDPANSVAEVMDSLRLVDIMAKVWAVSELGPELPSPVHVLAYRPDPVAASLRSVVESSGLAIGECFVFAPVGIEPILAHGGLAVLRLELSNTTRKVVRGPFGEVVHVLLEGQVEECLKALEHLAAKSGISLLHLYPVAGSNLDAPPGIEADIGLPANAELPESMKVIGRPSSVPAPGPWAAAVRLALSALARLRSPVEKEWEAAGVPAPPGAFRVLAMDGPAAALNLTVAVALPDSTPPGVEDRIVAALNAPDLSAHVMLAALPREGTSGQLEDATHLFPALALAGLVPRRSCMGPTVAQVSEDPGGTARRLGDAYLEAIRKAWEQPR